MKYGECTFTIQDMGGKPDTIFTAVRDCWIIYMYV